MLIKNGTPARFFIQRIIFETPAGFRLQYRRILNIRE